MSKTPSLLLTTTLLVAGLAVSACGESRHCEHDATDRTVADSFCEKNTPGYEWESGSDSKKKKRKKH
ncbi:hypothetical protein [Actinomadura sp. 9N407]|uniref:hypothetical protein n=1 Tax=Actinomadura sp. 9N407 TaxID=3375154 RepID=UPI0037BA33B7